MGKAVDCLAGEILSILAIASLPDFDIVVNFADRPLMPQRAEHAPDRVPHERIAPTQKDDVAPVFSVCSSSEFSDIPLPLGCAQVHCQDLNSRRARDQQLRKLSSSSHNGSQFQQEADLWDLLTRWKPSRGLAAEKRQATSGGVFAARCYLLQLLASYGELLRYAPGHVQTSLFSRSEQLQLRTFKLPRPLRRGLSLGDFEVACAEAVDDAAQ